MANKKAKTKTKAKKDNTPMIIGICVGVVAVIAIIVGIVFAVRGGSNALGDNYFVSDGSKYVLTIESDQDALDSDDGEPAPVKTHMVYTYSGDEVTGLKMYYEYADSATASKAYGSMEDTEEDGIESIAIDGKYIIITGDKSSYEGLTASDVKEQIEFMETLKNYTPEDSDDAEDVIESGETNE